jgi:hypothetical protein
MVAPGEREVYARVERFVEPALLLALQAGRSHGYELAERLADVIGVETVDYGNLYRLLRSLEQEGIVSSEWNDQTEGPAQTRVPAHREWGTVPRRLGGQPPADGRPNRRIPAALRRKEPDVRRGYAREGGAG